MKDQRAVEIEKLNISLVNQSFELEEPSISLVDQSFSIEKPNISLVDQSFLILFFRMCAVCSRAFNDTAFVRYPNGVVTHVHCAKNKHICPVTGKLFSTKRS